MVSDFDQFPETAFQSSYIAHHGPDPLLAPGIQRLTMVLVKGTVGFPELRKQGWRSVKSMASSELPFGPRSGSDPSVYLDTSDSEVVDATTSELPLYIPGENIVFEASFERLGSDLLLIRDGHSVLV